MSSDLKRIEKSVNVVVGKPVAWLVCGLWLATKHSYHGLLRCGRWLCGRYTACVGKA